MKTKLTIVLLGVLLLGLILTPATTAQGPEPGSSTGHTYPPPTMDRDGYKSTDRPPPSAGSIARGVSAAAVGQPGLSFRYVETFGVTEQAYLADVQHLNRPNGLFIDGSDNLYVVEEWGSRMLKYRTSDGANLLSIGIASLNIAGDYTFGQPQDVSVDNTGNIWVVDAHRAVQYNSSGAYQQRIGEWWTGDDETHFSEPRGVAFDSAGRMYISDRRNHRVQVYTFVSGSPVYSTTIGVTGVYGDDNAHFNHPTQIVIDSSDRLYVADLENFRVQRCTYAAGWTCTTFHGTGSQGSGDNELNLAHGLGIDSSDNIYIADNRNGRVKKCDSSGTCGIFASGFDWPADVAVDSTGNVYVSDWNDCTIRKYNSSGSFLDIFAGASDVPYLTDSSHFNGPYGIAVDSSGNIYLSTNRGYRVLKLNASGTAQWTAGAAGVWGNDNTHFGAFWEGPNNVAVDASGNVYVADTGNHRIQIYNGSGSYVVTLGSYGSGNYQFDMPDGVAIDSSGNIYVADSGNHRVQIYNSSRVYQATLGVTGVSDSDNAHFNYPYGVAVDSNGNIYVADGENHRVQIFNSSRAYVRTLGTTSQWGDDFTHFSVPRDVTVDAQGRVYVADAYNNRVQVFDSDGAYLTTIGGDWGSNTGQFRNVMAVDVDTQGNVYVADRTNHRIQKFAPGVPYWEQVNINGFGDRGNTCVTTLAVFKDVLYAGNVNDQDRGAEIWRNSGAWTAVITAGFGITQNQQMRGMTVFGDYLYVGTTNENGGEIWRSDSGIHWTQVVSQGFGDVNNFEVNHIADFNNMLYADTLNSTTGAEVWRSPTGAVGTWTQVNADGFGDANNDAAWFMIEFNSNLYVGTRNDTDGGEIWRTNDGQHWERITEGFGTTDNNWVHSFAVFKNNLYASTGNWASGGQIWRSGTGNVGDWSQIVGNGFGDPNNAVIRLAVVHDSYLYAVTANWVTGEEVWRTADGTTWEQVNLDGFGDSNNFDPFWNNAAAVCNDNLYLGTCNSANGGEIWRRDDPPQPPTILTVTAESPTTIRITWATNPEPDVLGYKLYWDTVAGRYANVIDVGNVTSYLLTGLEANTIYYLALSAYDARYEGGKADAPQTTTEMFSIYLPITLKNFGP